MHDLFVSSPDMYFKEKKAFIKRESDGFDQLTKGPANFLNISA